MQKALAHTCSPPVALSSNHVNGNLESLSLLSSKSSLLEPTSSLKLVPSFPKHSNNRQSFKNLQIRAYKEEPKSGNIALFFKKVQGNLPIVGLLSRLFSDEGGVGTDRLRLPEFVRKVEKNLTSEASEAMADFESRHGKMARKQIVLLWCWAAAIGAGFVKSEELLLSAKRLRASFDIVYEVEGLDVLMDEAMQKRAKSGVPLPDVPMVARVQKALEAIIICCVGSKPTLTETDARLLESILVCVFPSVDREDVYEVVERALSSREAEFQRKVKKLEGLGGSSSANGNGTEVQTSFSMSDN